MASVAVRCGGGVTCSMRQSRRNYRAPSNRNASTTMMIGGGRKEMMTPISISSSSSLKASRANRLETKRKKQRQEEAVSHENMIDEWMRDSVVEIVKNLREAPLLVHVYSDGDGNSNGSATRLRTEKAAPEEWSTVKREWENGTVPKPEGVIFVEQLIEDEVEEERESETSMDFGGTSQITRAWGIVVQSRGENCGPACYLLKTSGVGSGAGLGLCSTHFCLMKVKNFRETAKAQFKHCWLLN